MGKATKAMVGLTLALAAVAAACSGGSTDSTTPPPVQVGTVQGTVKDTGGVAVGGAALSLTASGHSALGATSAADGTFSFASVPVGTWTLTVAPPTGFASAPQSSVSVTVAAGQTATAALLLNRAGGGPPQSGNVSASISGFAFVPASLTITAGSIVTWKNSDAATHTVTQDAGDFDSGNLATGASFSETFPTKGTFTYHCAIHPGMKGTIVVQ